MILTRLLPDQIMRFWDGIKECIACALPPLVDESIDIMLQIQAELLLGNLECWIVTERAQSGIIYGVVTTRIVYDEISKQKNLLIYTAATVDDHPQEVWQESLDIMRRYAKSKQCFRIIAYSNNFKMLSIAQHIGADVSWRVIYFDI